MSLDDDFATALEAQRSDDKHTALDYYERCISATCKDDDERHTAALAKGNKGIILSSQGQFLAAEKLLNEAVSILRELGLGEEPATLSFLRHRADILNEQGALDVSVLIYNYVIVLNRKGQGILGASGDAGVEQTIQQWRAEELFALNSLGAAYLKGSGAKLARQIFTDCIDICQRELGNNSEGLLSLYINRAQAERELGNYTEALQDLEYAREQTSARHEIDRIDTLTGQIHAIKNNPGMAEAFLTDSITNALQAGNHEIFLKRLWLLASIKSHGKKRDDTQVQEAWELIEHGLREADKVTSSLTLAEFFQTAANVAHVRQDPEQEELLLGQSRDYWARLTQDQLDPRMRTVVASKAFDVYRRLSAIYASKKEWGKAFSAWEEGRSSALHKHLALRRKLDTANCNLETMIAWLKKRSAFCRTAVAAMWLCPKTEDDFLLYAMTIFPDKDVSLATKSISISDFGELLNKYNDAIPTLGEEWQPLALDSVIPLLTDLITPLFENIISEIDNLIIIPTYKLWSLPWSALFVEQRAAITVAPSATWLINQEPKPIDFSDISFSTIGYGQAGNTDFADESMLVASITHTTDCFTGEQATPERLKQLLGGTDVVHVSLHGNWSSEEPEEACLELFESNIFIDNILTIDSHVPLAILNACHSGRMLSAPNEDTVGLTPALLSAGVKNVLAGLWQIDAPALSKFIEKFVMLLRQGMQLSLATKEARNYLRTASADIRDWAVFEVFGSQ